MLIDTATLRRHLDDPSWLILDCRHDLFDSRRGEKAYGEDHIPGACFVPVETALAGVKTGRNGRHPLPQAGDFAGFLASLGATTETQLVAYDDAGGQYAARLWWMARWIGLTRVAVLDGGYSKWKTEGLPVTKAVPEPRPGGTIMARPDHSRVMTADEVMAGIGSGSCLVLDARAAERFRGEVEPVDPVAGHIPSARNRFFKINLNADLTMRSPAELKKEFARLMGERTPGEVVHQCGSGVTACANLLAMEHAGLTGSKLYAGSWSEWVSDPVRPVARGEI